MVQHFHMKAPKPPSFAQVHWSYPLHISMFVTWAVLHHIFNLLQILINSHWTSETPESKHLKIQKRRFSWSFSNKRQNSRFFQTTTSFFQPKNPQVIIPTPGPPVDNIWKEWLPGWKNPVVSFQVRCSGFGNSEDAVVVFTWFFNYPQEIRLVFGRCVVKKQISNKKGMIIFHIK